MFELKKYKGFYALLIAILLICVVVFFKPIMLWEMVNEDCQMSITLNELGVRNGEPYINSVVYQSVSHEQEKAILDLAKSYPYMRTPGTPFSDGTISDVEDKTLLISMYDDSSTANILLISSSGEIAVNNKNYYMKNADRFMEQIIEIVQ